MCESVYIPSQSFKTLASWVMISASCVQNSLNHMLMANQRNPKTQIRWYNIYRENICVAQKITIFTATIPSKREKKSSSVAVWTLNIVAKKGVNLTVEGSLRQHFLVAEVQTLSKNVWKFRRSQKEHPAIPVIQITLVPVHIYITYIYSIILLLGIYN